MTPIDSVNAGSSEALWANTNSSRSPLQGAGRVVGVGLGKDEQELVAADAADDVAGSNRLASNPGQQLESPVARIFAFAFVELAEVVDVGHRHGEGGAIPQHAQDAVLGRGAVGEAGEPVDIIGRRCRADCGAQEGESVGDRAREILEELHVTRTGLLALGTEAVEHTQQSTHRIQGHRNCGLGGADPRLEVGACVEAIGRVVDQHRVGAGRDGVPRRAAVAGLGLVAGRQCEGQHRVDRIDEMKLHGLHRQVPGERFADHFDCGPLGGGEVEGTVELAQQRPFLLLVTKLAPSRGQPPVGRTLFHPVAAHQQEVAAVEVVLAATSDGITISVSATSAESGRALGIAKVRKAIVVATGNAVAAATSAIQSLQRASSRGRVHTTLLYRTETGGIEYPGPLVLAVPDRVRGV